MNKIIDLMIFWLRGGVVYARRRGVIIGRDCRIFTKYFGSEPFLIKIGNKVTITRGVSFVTHDGSFWLFNDERGRRYKYQRIEVGDNVFIGINSIILPGVKIDNNVIIAAGSVVTKSVPSGVVIAGVPARIIGSYNSMKEQALKSDPSNQDMDFNLKFKERILKVVNESTKPYLEMNGNNS